MSTLLNLLRKKREIARKRMKIGEKKREKEEKKNRKEEYFFIYLESTALL
jgi:hypothetical protein